VHLASTAATSNDQTSHRNLAVITGADNAPSPRFPGANMPTWKLLASSRT
jgi:hypothetical protein